MKKQGIIAFCGSKFSGKSTSASLFKEMVGVPVEELALADHLKEVSAKVFNIEYSFFIDPNKKEVEMGDLTILDRDNLTQFLKAFSVEPLDRLVRPHLGRVLRTPRNVLQYLGTEVLHTIDPLIHAKIVLKKKNSDKLTIVTDLRFVAEFDFFNTVPGFVPVYVKNSQAEFAASVDAHPSERQLHDFKGKCYEINNEVRSIENLRSNVGKLIKDIYE